MPYKKPKIEKIHYSIGEVADIMGVNPSHIRYWSNQFDILKPATNKKGNRIFTKDDIETIRLIYHLVKEKGLTLKGAQQKLKDNRDKTISDFEIIKRLQQIRQELVELRDEMEDQNEQT